MIEENVIFHNVSYCGDIESINSYWYRIDFDKQIVATISLFPNEPEPFDEDDPDTDYHTDWFAVQTSFSFSDWNVSLGEDLVESAIEVSERSADFITVEEGILERDEVEEILVTCFGQ